ncbi:ricin-type beta-trefoil lectin domain protein [Actinosynnema sp. NPDC020468]|uniref:RICIN domain-containing protein n=1 Tax=Actinosynnema sp. NPDC020468 TaxID=3154488 RepID=UPI00340FE6D6
MVDFAAARNSAHRRSRTDRVIPGQDFTDIRERLIIFPRSQSTGAMWRGIVLIGSRIGKFCAALSVAVAVMALSTAAAPAATPTAAPRLPGVYQLFNQELPNGCLANHHPAVFLYTDCGILYADQIWTYNGTLQLVNAYSGKCLAAHADGSVFTFECNTSYSDQWWLFYQRGSSFQLVNWAFQSRCVAAHGDGSVFLFPCNENYRDQLWSRWSV